MGFKRMQIEEWFDDYQYEVDYNIGESGVKFLTLDALGLQLGDLPLRYGYHRGRPELRAAIASQYGNFSPEQIAVTTGASEAIFAVIASLVSRNDHMIVEHPNFPSHYELPASLDRGFILFHLRFEDEFKPDLDRLENLMTSRTRLITFTHPNNPTGSVISTKELQELVQLAESRNVYLLFDETYRELSFSDPPPAAATLSPRAISISTMSKAYGLPGIRIGWVAAEAAIIEQICAVREQLTICNSAISEEIALHVLHRKDELLRRVKRQVMTNYEKVKSWMANQKDLEWIPPQGGVVAFPRFKTDTPTEDFCRLVVKKYRTFIVPGSCFDMNRYFRIGFGGDAEEINAGLKQLTQALAEWEAI